MSLPDLTPKPYTQRNRSQRAIRTWSIACGLSAVVALIPIGLEQGRAPDASATRAREQLLLAENRFEQSEAEMKGLARLLKVHERELLAEKHLTERPDWSEVLHLVARQFDRSMVMRGFTLGSTEDSKVRSALGPLTKNTSEGSVWLIVTGVGESNKEVSALILRLEGLGLFHRVVMTETNRELFSGKKRIGFSLACRVH